MLLPSAEIAARVVIFCNPQPWLQFRAYIG
jgi:hypothetical protein